MFKVKGTLAERWRAQGWRGCPEQVRTEAGEHFHREEGG